MKRPLLSLFLLVPSLVSAQSSTGSVVGSVSDEGKRPLAGAEVGIAGGSGVTGLLNTSAAGRDGSFRLAGVSEGSQRVVVRYIGYQPETVVVAVSGRTAAQANVTMKRPIQSLEAIRIESAVAGQAAALNQQKASENLSSVVDAELVGRLPDRNLAEALGRVPGVALVRDQGEGRFVQIRGTNATLNTLSIDGMRMPSPDPSTRQTPMDVIPSDMVAAIQVNKTLTPDMDADAIGGNVNLVTPSPRSGMPMFSLNIAGGQNRINDGKLKNLSGYVGRRFGEGDKFGVMLGGSYYQNDRGSQNYEMGWCVETTCRGVAPASALDAPTQIALRNYSQVLRTREGWNGTLDYRMDNEHIFTLKGFFSKFSDDEERYVTTPSFSSGTYALTDANHGAVTGARMDKELRLRPVSQEQRSLQLAGKHVVGDATVDWTVQSAQAREDRPRSLTMAWRQSAMDFTYDVADEENPKFTVTKGAADDASKFLFNSLRQQTRHGLDDDNSLRLNVARPFTSPAVDGVVKWGVALRKKDRLSRDTSNRFLNTFKAGAPAPAAPVTLATLQGQPRTTNFLDGRFPFGPQASAPAVKAFWNSYGNSLNINAAQSVVETNSGSYDISESVFAAYGMATFDVSAVHLVAGARFESTGQGISGNMVKQAGTTVTITPQADSRGYTNVMPSLSARWSLDDRTTVRAAVTTSLVRANFADLPPTTNIPDGTGVTATKGNPGLKPIRSVNTDLMVERYFRSVGFVSVGLFHKDLGDYIFVAQRVATAADGLGATVANIAQPTNAETGKLDGAEFAWQQNLSMLPGMLRGLGVNANYTYTTSSTTLPSREGTKARLPGQAGNAANFGLFYDYSRLQLRMGYNFADKYLEVVGASEETDIYVASRGQLDFSGTVRIVPQATLFFETNNLTNQPLRRYEGRSERSWQPGNEYYRSWGMVGMRIQP